LKIEVDYLPPQTPVAFARLYTSVDKIILHFLWFYRFMFLAKKLKQKAAHAMFHEKYSENA